MTASYTALVDIIAADIAAGRLKAGERLPPQRHFAYEKGIAASTAARVYAELLRRGLVVGEVGRGTFVAGQEPQPPFRAEPFDGRIDLEFNFPTLADQAALIAKSLSNWQQPELLGSALAPVTQRRLTEAARVSADFFMSNRWRPRAEDFLFAGSGRQAIAAAVAALVPVGGRLAVEALTYPMIKGIAARLGVTLVPIAMDGEGIRPDALAKAHRTGALSAVYLQPVMQNPLGRTMSEVRRDELLRAVRKLDLVIIEDLIYGFLADEPPLAAEAAERSIVVDSLSKRLAPGIAVGFLHVPTQTRERVAAALRTGTWSVTPLALSLGMRLLADGTAAEITRRKRVDALARQAIVADCLAGQRIETDPRSYHVWLELPEGWRAEALTAAAARAGIAITPASAFAVAPGHSPNAVRLALGLPSHAELRKALTRLAALLAARPEETDVTE
ncbi:MAG TPA: PLP-dependent aminotransferase family protein [Bradyrhizobium sp.]|uniref:aminotransferase-like domain-containing protein n=1 Tax=Bradyrhizobium sp. TaxID=376 RepID=UPI002CBCA93D|nr:PLP-dependent aminotransferase family protein [Bradyrhizobium sp.]HLZ04889.1 PLP-dependent aminotransferase family protein [Bradyrhizobium sp.]